LTHKSYAAISNPLTTIVVTTVVLWVVVAVLFVVTRGQFGYETKCDAATTQTHNHSSEVQ
jgi:hypothetical protein